MVMDIKRELLIITYVIQLFICILETGSNYSPEVNSLYAMITSHVGCHNSIVSPKMVY